MFEPAGSGRPLIIAHRGASGYRPEHTLAAYQLSIEMGADYIETDLVLTADGALVARHDAELSMSTDIVDRPEFADRRTTTSVDGQELTGWFVDDLTLAELKTLRARERMPELRPANQRYDDQFEVATFDEIIALVVDAADRGQRVGVMVELKHSVYFADHGWAIEDLVLDALAGVAHDAADGQIVLACFEPTPLRRLAGRTAFPLVQLVDITGRPYDWEDAEDGRIYADMLTPSGLRELSTYAAGIGGHKSLFLPRSPDGRLTPAGRLVGDAHDLGLAVHAWALRSENTFLPAGLRWGDDPASHGDADTEYAAFLAAGVDGLITDYPDVAAAARETFLAGR